MCLSSNILFCIWVPRGTRCAAAVLEVDIARVRRKTKLHAAKTFAGRVKVETRMSRHGMDVAPVALQRVGLVIRAPTTRQEDPLHGPHAQPCQIGVIARVVGPLLKANWLE